MVVTQGLKLDCMAYVVALKILVDLQSSESDFQCVVASHAFSCCHHAESSVLHQTLKLVDG